ncbi:MAG: mannose-1-phosphate guanylyltransferase [Sedimentisphaerales bacterium]|nr:mannose-1-phosphate guanylyltransferase [Sedimentisphaerales bacterium]
MNYAVVMAGGTGKRLWPLSRKNRPKQVLKILAGQTLLQQCIERLLPVFDFRNIIALTNAAYLDLVRETAPQLPYENVIAEPVVRDTAGAIGLAAAILNKYDANATMAVVTADQIIEPAEIFQTALSDALTYINQNPDELFTFGIKPTFPSTQLGYIKYSESNTHPDCRNKILTIEDFKEKPDITTAEKYLESGSYLWNSGMFVWKAKTILKNLAEFLPDSTQPLQRIKADWDSPNQKQTLDEYFPRFPKISIDFAVMEKAKSVRAIELDCRWLDMGSFTALADIISSDTNNNIVVAVNSELLNCKNSIILTEQKDHLIAGIGLDNIVVAHTPDATLICPVDEIQRIKELLALIEKHSGEKFL